jgi:hypothetical protein
MIVDRIILLSPQNARFISDRAIVVDRYADQGYEKIGRRNRLPHQDCSMGALPE